MNTLRNLKIGTRLSLGFGLIGVLLVAVAGAGIYGVKDTEETIHEIVEDNRGRRVFPAAPEESLLLKKATGAVPHEGGARIEKNSEAYKTILAWMQQGMTFTPDTDVKLTSVTLEPHEKLYKKGARNQSKSPLPTPMAASVM